MKLINTTMDGVFILENFKMNDSRGEFVKIFHKNLFSESKLCNNFSESYFSVSHKDVIRGMHFQLPPHDHEKLVFVAKGAILDVVVDLRKNSKTYQHYIVVELSETNRHSLYIPKGCAHGFKSLEDGTITVYNVGTVYNSEFDCGILYDSFGFNWEIENPIISDRDRGFRTLEEFKSPF